MPKQKDPFIDPENPVIIWGRAFYSRWDIYMSAPKPPAIGMQTFKNRWEVYLDFKGSLDAEGIEDCLFSSIFHVGGYIYRITDLLTNKHYIGKTEAISRRWRVHRSSARYRKTPLQIEMDARGDHDFEMEPIVRGEFSYMELCDLERAFIATAGTLWPHGYNMNPGKSR